MNSQLLDLPKTLSFMLGGFELLIMLPVCVLGVAGTVLWIWMLVDCAIHETDARNEKLTWILIILFTHWIGGLLYLLIRRPKRIAEVGH